MQPRCVHCGAQNDPQNRFCSSCGKKFVARQEAVNAGEAGLYYCFKHKKEPTRLTCGRCEKPICTRCITVGANGVRCHSCARNKVPVRLTGILHDAGRTVGNSAASMGARPIWYLYIWGAILRIVMSFFVRW